MRGLERERKRRRVEEAIGKVEDATRLSSGAGYKKGLEGLLTWKDSTRTRTRTRVVRGRKEAERKRERRTRHAMDARFIVS